MRRISPLEVITVCSVAAMIAGAAILPFVGDASATHYWTGNKWQRIDQRYVTTPAGPYCFGSSLSNVNIGATGTMNAFGTAMSSINGLPAYWSIGPRVAWASNPTCRAHIGAYDLGVSTTLARVGLLLDGNYIRGADISINKRSTFSSSGCDTSPPPYRLSYVFRHEFTHWVEFKHTFTTGTPSSSTHSNYNCLAWDAFNGHDSGSLSAIYGSAVG